MQTSLRIRNRRGCEEDCTFYEYDDFDSQLAYEQRKSQSRRKGASFEAEGLKAEEGDFHRSTTVLKGQK